jgi:membrane-associated phospholipid phosphatase
MPLRSAGRFIRRRLSREEYLGLYLTMGMLASLITLGLFVGLAESIEGTGPIVQFDADVHVRMKESRDASPQVRDAFVVITNLGWVGTMTGFAVAGAIVLLLLRRGLLAFVWLFGQAGGGLLETLLKRAFERHRPPCPDISEAVKHTTSFPSGHSMGSLIGYGLLAYFVVLVLPRLWMRVVAVTLFSILVLAIGFSRVYLGAHYPTDVLGGFTVGGCWLAACISALEMIRRRPVKVPAERNAAPPI